MTLETLIKYFMSMKSIHEQGEGLTISTNKSLSRWMKRAQEEIDQYSKALQKAVADKGFILPDRTSLLNPTLLPNETNQKILESAFSKKEEDRIELEKHTIEDIKNNQQELKDQVEESISVELEDFPKLVISDDELNQIMISENLTGKDGKEYTEKRSLKGIEVESLLSLGIITDSEETVEDKPV